MQMFSLFKKSEHGGGLIEYSLIIALIAIASIAALTTLGTNINTAFTSITGHI